MRKWATNSPNLNEQIRKEIATAEGDNSSQEVLQPSIVEVDESYSKTTLHNAVCTDKVKVMGMPWDTNSDVLKFFKFENLVNNSEKTSVTKRAILSTAARFFDPLGLLSPITIPSSV